MRCTRNLAAALALSTTVLTVGTVAAPTARADFMMGNCLVVENPTPTNHSECTGANLGTPGAAGVDFSYAELDSSATSGGPNLSGGVFRDANLTGAVWNNIALIGADFEGATLTAISLFGAVAYGASFNDAIVRDANLSYGVVHDASFVGADLTGADLTGAYFGGGVRPPTDFTGATLDGTTFTGTSLVPANPEPVAATGASGAAVTWPVPPSEIGAEPGPCSDARGPIASGGVFPVGTTTVTCKVVSTANPLSFGLGTFTVTVNGVAPTIASANQTTYTVGSAGSFTITAAGTPIPAVTVTGALPAGMTFTDNGDGTATLDGTPTQVGTFPLTITATNGTSPDATQTFTLTVNGIAPTITSPDQTTFTVDSAGSFTITTTGTPTPTITATGTLPAGVTLIDNGDGTATLGGTPTDVGTYPFTIAATNGTNPDATQTFTLTVNGIAPTITSPDQTTFTVDSAGSFTITTTGTPTPTITATGTLPAGVTLIDNGDGTATLGGTPTDVGTYPFTITATNGTNPDATQTFTLTVNGIAPTITSPNQTTFTVGTAGSFTITTTGTPTPTLTVTGVVPGGLALAATAGLPDGVTFTDNGDGTATLAGTPTHAGTHPVTITAVNGTDPDATQNLTILVRRPPSITSPGTPPPVTVGEPTTITIGTSGYPAPTIIASGPVPPGMTFTDNGDGTAALTGTPTQAGTYAITITATDGVNPDATQTITLAVLDPLVVTATVPNGTVGAPYTADLTATGGTGNYTWRLSAGTLPPGLNLDPAGTISGTPVTAGTYTFTVEVNDAATMELSITIAPAPGPPTTTTTPPTSPPTSPPTTAPPATDPIQLPVTGSDPAPSALLALVALALGGLFLVPARKRRR